MNSSGSEVGHLPVTDAASLRVDSHSPRSMYHFVHRSITQRDTEYVRDWLDSLKNMIDREGQGGTQEVKSHLESGKIMMSGLYFGGSLDGVPLALVDGLLTNRQAFGITWGMGQATRIEIDPLPVFTDGNNSRAEQVAATLLHELCHALLSIYSCKNIFCRNKKCNKRGERESGVGGHALAWNMVAREVEKAAESHFQQKLSLAREKCSVNERKFLAKHPNFFQKFKRACGDSG